MHKKTCKAATVTKNLWTSPVSKRHGVCMWVQGVLLRLPCRVKSVLHVCLRLSSAAVCFEV